MKSVVKSALLVGLMMFGMALFAQSVTDAGEIFNQGNTQFKAKAFGQAVNLYEKALKMCKTIGPDAADLQSQVESQLTTSYFWNGISFYKKRDFDQAIAQLKKAKAMAISTNNAKIKNYAHIYIARVYVSKGNALFKSEKAGCRPGSIQLCFERKYFLLSGLLREKPCGKREKRHDYHDGHG